MPKALNYVDENFQHSNNFCLKTKKVCFEKYMMYYTSWQYIIFLCLIFFVHCSEKCVEQLEYVCLTEPSSQKVHEFSLKLD